jgi:hypothetical protein
VDARTANRPLLALAALLLAVLLAYLPGLGGGYVFDDYPNIVNNTALHVAPGSAQDWIGAAGASPARNLPRPLSMLSFAANHWFTGLDPAPLKATNLAIHLLNVLLVFGLSRALLRFRFAADAANASWPDWLALAVAAAWGLHPLNLMAVLFVVQRMESLAHVFVFGGLWLYVAARQRQLAGAGGGWTALLAALVGATALGVLAKESAALLPLYAFLVEACLFGFRTRPGGSADRRLQGLYVVVLWLPALLGGAWQTWAALDPASYAGREFSLGQRLLTEPRVLLQYLRWIVLPDLGQLSLYHDDLVVSRGLLSPPATLLALLLLPALALLAWLARRRWPLAALGGLWFFAAHLLTATVVPLELVFEHRNYFAVLGACLVGAEALAALWRSRWRAAALPLALAIALALGGLTTLRAREWSDPVAFAASEVAKHPDSPRATYYLGWMLAAASGFRSESPFVEQAFAALERARQVPNAGALPAQAALVLAARTGRPQRDAWWRDLQATLRSRPLGPQETGALAGLTGCAVQRLCQFPREEMVETFASALARGDHPEVLNNYGNYALNVLGDQDLALRAWTRAAELSPGEPQYRIALVKLQILRHHDAEARAGIARLRAMGRFGQYEREARELEQRLRLRGP